MLLIDCFLTKLLEESFRETTQKKETFLPSPPKTALLDPLLAAFIAIKFFYLFYEYLNALTGDGLLIIRATSDHNVIGDEKGC